MPARTQHRSINSKKIKARQRPRRHNATKPKKLPPRSTAPLSESELTQLMDAMVAKYGWSEEQTVRPFQVAGIRAQLEGTDTIIQAPTGSGKTLIAAGPHSSPRSSGMITIISVPLVQLAEDMVRVY